MAQPTLFDGSGPLVVYTDGACSGNPGPGGWAWAVAPQGEPHGAGGERATTNQRMEITAALEALRALASTGRPIKVVSDSTYVVNCFRDRWYVKWQANGWHTTAKKPVANADLWRPLIELALAHRVTFGWVKGHSGDVMNDKVDVLAVAAIPRGGDELEERDGRLVIPRTGIPIDAETIRTIRDADQR